MLIKAEICGNLSSYSNSTGTCGGGRLKDGQNLGRYRDVPSYSNAGSSYFLFFVFLRGAVEKAHMQTGDGQKERECKQAPCSPQSLTRAPFHYPEIMT